MWKNIKTEKDIIMKNIKTILSNKDKEVIEIALHELSCADCPYTEDCIDEDHPEFVEYDCVRINKIISNL